MQNNIHKALLKKLILQKKNSIDKNILSEKIKNFTQLGILNQKRDCKVIVSLTSFPERMEDICYCLYSLLNQEEKPDELILWLGEEEFPNSFHDIPNEVLNLQKNGLTIKFTKDIKSYKKLIPSLVEYPHDIIITADDDLFYSPLWLKKLLEARKYNHDNILAHRVHKITFDLSGEINSYSEWEKEVSCANDGYKNFCTTGGGVLFPPHSLHSDVLREDIFMKLCPTADDIWFWSMAVLNHRKICLIDNPENKLCYINPERELGFNNQKTLSAINLNLFRNDVQLKQVLNYYPELYERIRENS